MSVPSIPPEAPELPPPPQGTSGCMTAFLLLLGILLLLPGLCALLAMGQFGVDTGFVVILLITAVIAAVGIWLIRIAVRGR